MSEKCEEIRPHLFDYSVGEVDDERRAEVEAHLAECAECRSHLQELEGTGVALKKVPALSDIEATEELRHATRRLARVESQKRIAIAIEKGLEREPRRVLEVRRRAARGPTPGAKMLAAAVAIGVTIAGLIVLDRVYRSGEHQALGDSVAKLEASVGKVEVFFRSAADEWSDLAVGRRLFKGESVRTGEGSVARFRAAGGKTIWLGPLTRAAFTETLSEYGVALRVERGAAVVAAPGKPYRIEADFGMISGNGGSVHVASVAGAWWLDVLEGTARVKSHGVNEISAGHCSSISAEGAVDLGESDLTKVALWRYRILTGDLLDRLFPGRSARLLKDGRAFIEYADIRGRLEPGAARRLDGVFAGDVSFAVEVGEWQPGRLSVGLAEPGGKGCPKLEFVPGKGGATLVKYSSGGKMASGSADPLPAGLSDKVRLRLERSGSDCRVHIGDAAVGTFRTDFTGPLQPVVKALEKAVEVRSVTVSGRPDEQWIGEKLRAAAPK